MQPTGADAPPSTQTAESQPSEQDLSRFESEGGSTGPILPDSSRESGTPARVLIVYATRQRHLCVIADAIAARLSGRGFTVEIGDASTGTMPPPQDYDAVILGFPLDFGHSARLIATYIDRNRAALAQLPVALFTVSKSGTVRDHDMGGFLEEFLRAVHWLPDLAAAFAGGEPFPRKGPMLRLAKWMGHPGGQDSAALRTDWISVRQFADAIATRLSATPTAEQWA